MFVLNHLRGALDEAIRLNPEYAAAFYERGFAYAINGQFDRAIADYAGGLPGCGDIATELRDELLNGEIFCSLKEGQIVIEQWRKHYQHDQAALIARISTACATDNEPVPDTARSGRAIAIVSQPRWYKKIRQVRNKDRIGKLKSFSLLFANRFPVMPKSFPVNFHKEIR